MTVRSVIVNFVQQEDVNFLLTNRLPRRWITLFVGWLSRLEQPLVCRACLAVWRLFADIDLSDAQNTRFRSLHECFTRELTPGARQVDHDSAVVVSPCDGIVGAMGPVCAGSAFQAKGFPYSLLDLLDDSELVARYLDGCFVTLRLTSGMYHRFHAPYDCRVEHVTYMSGDTWNVNPIALKRVENLFCRNERAVIRCRLAGSDHLITLVPVAAILVASIRLHCVDVPLNLKYRGPNRIPCDAWLRKGEEMGWFEHGSTVIAFAPPGVSICPGLTEGSVIRMGQPLLRLAPHHLECS
ncbi:archaetidylserine decarboxylase [Mycobacterium camsae]|uniref:archaetidylserine decarboxylase n=1 Tax=Mycobacterium gordonae TaxID=1778 RepID=UPI0019817EE7|nr:archaetidylserine decarboxylase [Mycobacterium gordonae]